MSNSKFQIVLITVPNDEIASSISRHLVENKLVACVQIIPNISSIFWWKGKIEKESELLLIAKTVSEKYLEVEIAVKSLHPYEVPEIIAVDISQGSESYLKWVEEESR